MNTTTTSFYEKRDDDWEDSYEQFILSSYNSTDPIHYTNKTHSYDHVNSNDTLSRKLLTSTGWGPIQSLMNHKSIDANQKQKGNRLRMWGSSGWNSWNQNQVFSLGSESIMLYGTNLCLDGYPSTAGTRVFLWDCHSGSNQKWFRDGQGRIRLRSNEGMCLDIWYANPNDGAELVIWPCHDGPNMKWYQSHFPTWTGNDRNGLIFNLPAGEGTNGNGNDPRWLPADGCTGMGGAQYQWELNPACNQHDICYYCTGTPGWNLNTDRCTNIMLNNARAICDTMDWWHKGWCHDTVRLLDFSRLSRPGGTGDCANGPHKIPYSYATKPVRVWFPGHACNGVGC